MGEGAPGGGFPPPKQDDKEKTVTTPEKKETNLERIEREEKYVAKFRDELKVITSGETYKDPYGFSEASLDGFDEDTKHSLKYLIGVVMGPVLKDNIEDSHDENGRVVKGVRKEYRAKVNALGQMQKDFYDSNKLEAGTIAYAFTVSSLLEMELAAYNKNFSDKTKEEYATLQKILIGENNPHPDDPQGYTHLKNDGKYEFEKKYTKLLERILCDALGKEFKN